MLYKAKYQSTKWPKTWYDVGLHILFLQNRYKLYYSIQLSKIATDKTTGIVLRALVI